MKNMEQEIEIGLKVLSIIETAISEWRKLKDGDVNPSDVIERLNALTKTIAANDAAADAALDSKFPK